MDRRETIKSLLVGSISAPILIAGCQPEKEAKKGIAIGPYGRTDKEKAHDTKVMGETFFNEHESDTIAILCDLILPATATAISAKMGGVPEFISFIVKDIKDHQVPMRGGLMWLDHRSRKLHGDVFMMLNEKQQKSILDEIAYPDDASPEVEQGVSFFSLMRNLVLTGYYTSKAGITELGYQGNVANVWDGVPEEVLAKHQMSYDPEWLKKCVDQSKRENRSTMG